MEQVGAKQSGTKFDVTMRPCSISIYSSPLNFPLAKTGHAVQSFTVNVAATEGTSYTENEVVVLSFRSVQVIF